MSLGKKKRIFERFLATRIPCTCADVSVVAVIAGIGRPVQRCEVHAIEAATDAIKKRVRLLVRPLLPEGTVIPEPGVPKVKGPKKKAKAKGNV